jgi:nucleoside-diphosphate-sugar epimerase
MSRVLLTGASGFIGRRAIQPLLDSGHDVHAVCRKPPGRGGDGPDSSALSWHALDLLDHGATCAAVRELSPDALLHFAWYADHGSFWTAPENLAWTGATLNLVRQFAESGGVRAVIAGSCAEYQWGVDDVCSEATTPLQPATLYGAAKHATQSLASAYASSAGLELAWGRIFLCYGPDEDRRRLVPAVIRALLEGHEAKVTDGTQRRDLIHTDDLARAFVALLDSDVQGAVNVASGEPVRLADVIALIADEIGRPELIRLGAIPRREGDPQVLGADVSRLRGEVGFQPRIGLAQGIRETVSWWRGTAA